MEPVYGADCDEPMELTPVGESMGPSVGNGMWLAVHYGKCCEEEVFVSGADLIYLITKYAATKLNLPSSISLVGAPQYSIRAV